MLHTGAKPNLIKLIAIDKNTIINTDNILYLTDIRETIVSTLGRINVDFLNNPKTFHIVPDGFPLSDGLVRVKLLK